MLKRATGAKEATERAEIEEALKLAYIDLVGEDVLNHKKEVTLGAAVQKVKQQGYDDKIVIASGGSTSYKLSSSSIILGSSAPNNTAQITVEEDTTADSGSSYYAIITGKYYEIKDNNNGDIKIATTASDVDLSGGGSSSSAINLQDGNVTFGTANVATATASGSTIILTASGTGTSTITVNVNGKNVTGNVEVVGRIIDLTNNKNYYLDGAMIPKDATAGTGKTVSSSDTSIAQVTTEGIVKCGTKTGETTVKIDNTAYKIKSTARIVQAGANKTLDGSTTGTANNPIIPTGFYAINTDTAEWKDDDGNSVVASNINNGLVIMDEKGNQFVWVPVPNAIYDSSKEGDLPISTTSGTNNGQTYTPMAIDVANGATQNGAYNADGTYKGILYGYNATAGAYLMSSSAINKQSTVWREPDIVSGVDTGSYTPRGSSEAKTYLSVIEDTINAKYKSNSQYSSMGNFGNTMQKDYNIMVQSVATRGGFYIGRYESSIINNQTRVVAGQVSMCEDRSSANMWYGLYARQKNFAVDNELTSVESDMVWGSQYDAMMNWMQSSGIDVTATAGSNGTAKNDTMKTGIVAGDKLNNVFDLFGCRREWTLVVYSEWNRAYRGGNFTNGSRSPSYRGAEPPSMPNDYNGSRPALYVQ